MIGLHPSLEWVRLPSIEREFNLVAHVFSYCDESGKEDSHDIVVFNALMDVQSVQIGLDCCAITGWIPFTRKKPCGIRSLTGR